MEYIKKKKNKKLIEENKKIKNNKKIYPIIFKEIMKDFFNNFITNKIKKNVKKYKIRDVEINYGIYTYQMDYKYLIFKSQTKTKYCPIRKIDTKNKKMFHSNNNSILCINFNNLTYYWVCHGCVYKNTNIFKKSIEKSLPDFIIQKYKNDIINIINEIKNNDIIDINFILNDVIFN